MANEYQDLDLRFTPHPMTGDLVMKKDVRAVMQAMKTLVLSSATELLLTMEADGGVYALLFSLNTPRNIMLIQRNVETVILNHEPRVDLHTVEVTPFSGFNGVEIVVTFSMKNQNEVFTLEIPVERLR